MRVWIGVVLVDQQVDHPLSEGDVVRRPVVPLQRPGIDGKRFLCTLQVTADERPPGLHEVGLDHQPVGPALLGEFLRPVPAAPLPVHDGTRQQLTECGLRAEQQHRCARRPQPIAGLDDESPMVQEFQVGQRFVVAGVPVLEVLPVPAQ